MLQKVIKLPKRANISPQSVNDANLQAAAGTVFFVVHNATKIEYFHHSDHDLIETKLSQMNVDRRDFPRSYWLNLAQKVTLGGGQCNDQSLITGACAVKTIRSKFHLRRGLPKWKLAPIAVCIGSCHAGRCVPVRTGHGVSCECH